MNLGLTGKVALVTAASRGLGKAVAMSLALEGAEIALCARGEECLSRTAMEIGAKTGRRVLSLPADVSDPVAVDALVQATAERFGRIDILVTNAGGPPSGQFLDLTPEEWEAAARLTLMSVVHLCYVVIPLMKLQGGGSILAMTSVAVKQPLPNLVLSNSLRLAVVGLIKTLADELAPFGIRANVICPGWTRTARVDQLLVDRAHRYGTAPETEASAIVAGIPLGRMGTPEEFATAAVFLASPIASYITGACLLVDGGMHRGTT